MPAEFNVTRDADTMQDFADAPLTTTRRALNANTVESASTQLAPLNYDFDIVEAAPDPAQKAHLDALAALGQSDDTLNLMMCWRDPRTVATMKTASPEVRDIFESVGFGYQASGRRIPTGSYDISEGPLRHETVMQLTNRLAKYDAEQLNWGQIDIAAFFKTTAEASGIRTGAAADVVVPQSNEQKRKIAKLVLLAGIALIIMAAFAML